MVGNNKISLTLYNAVARVLAYGTLVVLGSPT